jgi:hypothetical protein
MWERVSGCRTLDPNRTLSPGRHRIPPTSCQNLFPGPRARGSFSAQPINGPWGFKVGQRIGHQAQVTAPARLRLALVALAMFVCTPTWADCFDLAGSRYGIAPSLLRAVASAESDLRPSAVNETHSRRTGTRDIGLMQINTGWLPTLAKYGIREPDLFEPCTNVGVGAWVLAHAFARHGKTWQAVGAYNAACTSLKGEACQRARTRYAWRVYRRLDPAQPTPQALAAVPPVRFGSPGLVSVASTAGTATASATTDVEAAR